MSQDHRILNRVPSRNVGTDWLLEHLPVTHWLLPAPPASLDLRSPDWSIGNQGDSGSCVGWATAEGVMRWLLSKVGKSPIATALSARFVWMAAKETDTFVARATTFIESEGTSVKAAAQVCTDFGVVPDAALPFSGTLYRDTTDRFYALAATLKASSYYNLSAARSNWRAWLARHGPILIGSLVDPTWDWAYGPAPLDLFQSSAVRGAHAVSIVGYTPTTFIVRNSWGTNWGDRGFAYVTDNYAAQAFTEAYGLVA